MFNSKLYLSNLHFSCLNKILEIEFAHYLQQALVIQIQWHLLQNRRCVVTHTHTHIKNNRKFPRIKLLHTISLQCISDMAFLNSSATS